MLGGEPFVPAGWAWLVAALAGPVAALGWFLVWRRVFPDAARLARLRRSRAARRAADAIRRAARTPDPAATIAGALLGYLRTRFPLPEGAATPPPPGTPPPLPGVLAAAVSEALARPAAQQPRWPDPEAVAHVRAIHDDHGRIIVLMTHNNDFGDAFEEEATNHDYFLRFSVAGYAFGVDTLVYALTH